MSQTAAGKIRKQMKESSQGSDGKWVAIGLLAVADSLESVSSSIDGLAKVVGDAPGALAQPLTEKESKQMRAD